VKVTAGACADTRYIQTQLTHQCWRLIVVVVPRRVLHHDYLLKAGTAGILQAVRTAVAEITNLARRWSKTRLHNQALACHLVAALPHDGCLLSK
jgi:hypothetical protein